MEENRVPKRVWYMNLGTTRLRGRPRNRWQDEVREDGRIVGGEGWQEKVHNREEWNKLLRMARNRRILHMPMELMNGILNSNFIGITNLHVSGSLSVHHQEFLAVYRLSCILCSCDEPFATRSRMELQPTPGIKWSTQLHTIYQSRCTAKNAWWWAERLPETCRVEVPIKLEFRPSVDFIHKKN